MKTAETLPRPSCSTMDAILGTVHRPESSPALGFVRLIDYMGDEAAVCQAARVSYGAGTKTVNEDRGLLRYLMRHRHTTPFEMCEIKLHLKMPIFVARQWIRHRTANVNEYSARYSIMEREFFTPPLEHMGKQSTSNKQGRDILVDGGDSMWKNRSAMISHGDGAFDLYEALLEDDLARESARAVLPLSTMTEMYWKVDLHNLLHFLNLRVDPHAQQEIRDLAKLIENIVAQWVPNIHEAWCDYVREAVTFSGTEMQFLQAMMQEYFVSHEMGTEAAGFPPYEIPALPGLSDRERKAFLTNIGLGEEA